MSSNRRRLSSQRNGRKSHGPVTPEGKARSAMNALRHGLLAKQVVVGNESPDGFRMLLDEHVERFGELDGVESGMLEEMAASYWRMRRAWAIEQRWMEQAIAASPTGDMDEIANAFGSLAETNKFKLLQRYESRMHRMYQKSLNTLLKLKEPPAPQEQEIQPEPELQPEPANQGPIPVPPQPPPPRAAPNSKTTKRTQSHFRTRSRTYASAMPRRSYPYQRAVRPQGPRFSKSPVLPAARVPAARARLESDLAV